MAKHSVKNQETISGRISILFFFTLLMMGFARLLRFANDRFNLVFRGWLPWLLPILLAGCIAGLWLCRKKARKGEGEEKLFAPAFGAYLLVAPLLVMVPSALAVWLRPLFSSLETLGLVKLASRLSVCLLIGYFIGYILYYHVKPVAGLLSYGIAAQIGVVYYYFTTQLARTTSTIAPFDGLTPVSGALLAVVLAAGVTLGMLLLSKKEDFALPKVWVWAPFFATVLFLLVTLIFVLSFTVREYLLLGYCLLQWILLAIVCVLIRKKK